MTGSAKGKKTVNELRARLIEEAGYSIGELAATELVTEFERLSNAMLAFELGEYYGEALKVRVNEDKHHPGD